MMVTFRSKLQGILGQNFEGEGVGIYELLVWKMNENMDDMSLIVILQFGLGAGYIALA